MTGLVWFLAVTCAISITLYGKVDTLHCFACSNMTNGDDCRHVNQCATNEICYMERNALGNTTTLTSGCINSQRCPSQRPFTIIGRSTQDNCVECCSHDGCNKDLCESKDIPAVKTPGSCEDDPLTNCSRMSSLVHICSDMQANQLCRKYCGLCNQVAGGWAMWGNWSPCSKTCGIGLNTRKRTCSNPVPQQGGALCPGNDTQVNSCFDRTCPVHGEWNNWGAWEGCSVPCGTGVNKRHRACSNPTPSLYGRYCFGDAVDFDICTGHACGNTTTTIAPTKQTPLCFDSLNDCDLLNQTTGFCNSQQNARKLCPEFCGLCSIADGYWAGWSSWGTCSTTCGNGTWSRSRTCTKTAAFNGDNPCPGSSTDNSVCNLRDCPVHGNWSPWGKWTSCSASCGQGLTHRRRACTNPRPSFNGNYCFDDSTEYAMCLVRKCQDNTIPTIIFNANKLATLTPSKGQALVFTSVVRNTGNGYSSTTGKFTAPVNGTYSFTVQICSYSPAAYLSLVLDGNIVTPLINYHISGPGTSSSTTPLFMKQGQKVWVRSVNNCSSCLSQHSSCWSQFSGILVHY